jgi:hypothetical protein
VPGAQRDMLYCCKGSCKGTLGSRLASVGRLAVAGGCVSAELLRGVPLAHLCGVYQRRLQGSHQSLPGALCGQAGPQCHSCRFGLARPCLLSDRRVRVLCMTMLFFIQSAVWVAADVAADVASHVWLWLGSRPLHGQGSGPQVLDQGLRVCVGVCLVCVGVCLMVRSLLSARAAGGQPQPASASTHQHQVSSTWAPAPGCSPTATTPSKCSRCCPCWEPCGCRCPRGPRPSGSRRLPAVRAPRTLCALVGVLPCVLSVAAAVVGCKGWWQARSSCASAWRLVSNSALPCGCVERSAAPPCPRMVDTRWMAGPWVCCCAGTTHVWTLASWVLIGQLL